MSEFDAAGAAAAGARTLTVPELSLVALVGASGSGKSTFAAQHFLPTEVLSSDFFRGLVADDETDQSATRDAFDVLHTVVGKRLAAGRLAVVDATNVQREARRPLLELARRYHAMTVAIVFDMSETLCRERNATRSDRTFGRHVIRQQRQQLRRSLKGLQREGWRYVHVLRLPDEVDTAGVRRERMWTDRRDECGPFDIIGDVHGCIDELCKLLVRLGYAVSRDATGNEPAWRVAHPEGRRAVFVGDLCDRGPGSHEVFRLVMDMVDAGTAICVPGNHDVRLLRKLRGRDVRLTHGLPETLEQLAGESDAFRERLATFLDGLISHFVLDDGRLVVAHAGMKAEYAGRASGRVRQFALYGETTGETDEFGLPVRADWAADYRGSATVVYGHTPVSEAAWLNNTLCIDTGCVFGGRLTALRWPERELVAVDAARVYCEPVRPLETDAPAVVSVQQQHDELLDLADVSGKRIVRTRLRGTVTIREENAAAALEVMSRFAVDPRWLVYLPPTMSPCETSAREDVLEHPDEAFSHFRSHGVPHVVCQEKHMGSRAVLVVCRSEDAARRRFGVESGRGVVVTRTGRPFFRDDALSDGLLARVADAATAAGLWDELATDWLVLDGELMPWSAKAQALLRDQYAATGAAASAALADAAGALEQASARGLDVTDLQARTADHAQMVADYTAAWRRYCWPVGGLEDLRLAPFHLLASEGHVHVDRDHHWHMDVLGRLCAAGGDVLQATRWTDVDTTDTTSREAGAAWWTELTAGGGEGMVVKPRSFVARGPRGLVQPALKVRGSEYLRIIYGPTYTAPDQLARLRQRAVGRKRSLALREFALGVEALDRFVRGEPLRRVHECVFGVLAMESEPVDPRL